MKHEKIIDKLDLLDESLNDLEYFEQVLHNGDSPDKVEEARDNKKAETSFSDFIENTPEQIQCLVDRVQAVRSNLVSLITDSSKKTNTQE